MAKKEAIGRTFIEGTKVALAGAVMVGTGFVTLTACSTLAPVVPATKVAQTAFRVGSYGFASVTSTTAYALSKDELDAADNEIRRRVQIHRLKIAEKPKTEQK